MVKRIVLSLALLLALLSPVVRAAPEAAESEAKPSLVPDMTSRDTYYSAVWIIIIFIIMLAILYPTAWKNVLAGLKSREERIRGDIADAEAARAKAEATLKEYTTQLAAAEAKARETINAAAIQGEKLAAQIRTTAQQEAEEIKERTNKDIAAARDAAIKDVRDQAATLSTMIAEKILRRNLNAADQQDLVRQSLEELQTLGK